MYVHGKMFSSQMSELTFSPLATKMKFNREHTQKVNEVTHSWNLHTSRRSPRNEHRRKKNAFNENQSTSYIARSVCHSVCKRFYFNFIPLFFFLLRFSKEYLAQVYTIVYDFFTSFVSFRFVFIFFFTLFVGPPCSLFIFLLRIVIGAAGWRAPLLL